MNVHHIYDSPIKIVHSCLSNCVKIFEGKDMKVTATQDVKPGERVRIRTSDECYRKYSVYRLC